MPEPNGEFAYLKDLRRDRAIKVRCRQCRHRGEVSVPRILRKFTDLMPLGRLRRHFLCLECGTKGNVDLDPRDALS